MTACVKLHDSKLGKCHLAVLCKCLVIDAYYCHKGVLTTGCAKGQSTAISGDLSISVDNWRIAGRTLLRDVANDSANLKVCNCGLAKTVDLTDDPTVLSSTDGFAVVSNTTVHLAHR